MYIRQYIIKRIIQLIPIFFGVSVIIFALIYTAPGDPYAYMVESGLPIEEKEIQLAKIGYYDPLPVKYMKWVGNTLQGNLGYSIRYGEPVTAVISRRIGNTAMLSVTAMFLSTVISVVLGILSAVKKKTFTDYLISLLSLIGISIPAFFLALGLIKILAIDFNIFPVSGIETVGENYRGFERALDIMRHMFLPLTVITLTQTASMMRYTRSAMIEVLDQDYMRTAKAKGLSRFRIINIHGLRNALISIITIMAVSLGQLLSGTVLIETLSICILLANLLADIFYALADPRIRFN